MFNAEVEPIKGRVGRTEPFRGKVGPQVATSLLMNPLRPAAVRELARDLGRSSSTVSEVLAAFRRDEWIDATNTVSGTELFWAVTERWATPRRYLARVPDVDNAGLVLPLRLGLDDVEHEPGWALADSIAAVTYGAPFAVKLDSMLAFFVGDESAVRSATTLLGAAEPGSHALASARVAPVPPVVVGG